MQGPWAYDDSMGGHAVAGRDDRQTCETCGSRSHAEACAPRET